MRPFPFQKYLPGFLFGVLFSAVVWYTLLPIPNSNSASVSSPGKPFPEAPVLPVESETSSSAPDSVLLNGPKAPVLFSQSSVDFGLRLINESVSEVLQITNQGDADLDLLAVSPTCGCLSTDFTGRMTLARGETTDIRVFHEVRAMPSSTSESLRFVFLGYQLESVPVTVEFTRPIKADPTYLDLDRIDSGELTLRSLDERPFRILSVMGEAPAPADGFQPLEPSPIQRITWDLSKFDKELCQSVNGVPMPKWIVIETDHPDAPLVDVRVRHYPCTVLDLPLQETRDWYLNTHRIILGQFEPGASSLVSVPVEYLEGTTRVDPLELDVTGLKDLEVEIDSYPGRDKLASTTLNLRIRKKNDAAPGFGLERLLVRGTVSGLDQEIQLFHSYRPEG